ncbi:MAG: sensor domain-containing diguanylate cyclase, partial [Alphaproteobacteria bacterium]|nr:sensor domain-containing diguanylate cyclase [Alphaproteobacteria bacterium]
MQEVGRYSYPVVAHEAERLSCLHQLEILDTGIDPAFEQIVELTKSLFRVPIVLVTIVDEQRLWFKSRRGIDTTEIERGPAFCNHTILSRDVLVIEDMLLDSRFVRNPSVTSKPHFRFYAGCPLEMQDGLMAGSLCILDYEPRTLTAGELDQLRMLGAMASALLTQYSNARRMRELSIDLGHAAQLIENQRQDLQTQKRLMDCASNLAKIGAWEIDCQSGRWMWSDGMYSLHEVDRDYLPSQAALEGFYLPEDYQRLIQLVEQSRQMNEPYLFEGEMITAKGNKRWVRVAGHVELRNGVAVRRYGMKQDITEEKLAVLEIKRLAERDPLTGLCNRVQFMRSLADIKSRRIPLALIMLDLDGFKDINDTHGHSAGDECLKEIGKRLEALADRSWLVARLGGDEFAIIIENPDSK